MRADLEVGRRLLEFRFRLLEQRRHRRLVLERVSGLPLVVLPEVFHPSLFYSSQLLGKELEQFPLRSEHAVLDLGTGSGLLALLAARRAGRVLATDVNPDAVRCLRINALLNRLEDRVEGREGDLFTPVEDERFDLILFNPPYFEGSPKSLWDRSWRDETEVRRRFAAQLGTHLRPAGAAVLVDSSGATSPLDRTLAQVGFQVSMVRRKVLLTGEQLSVFLVRPGK